MPIETTQRPVGPKAIKDRAREIILAHLPEWKQANLTARQAALMAIRAGTFVLPDGTTPAARDWTAGETAELAAISAAWAWVEQVRDASDTFEATLAGGGSPNFHARSAWPAYPAGAA
jgi:hypothetical protein